MIKNVHVRLLHSARGMWILCVLR